MLALGTVVGGSFFLGTAVVLHNAGPGALLAFAFGGIVTYLVLTALSELTVSRPTHGSFRAYAAMAFGPMASFVVGWLYWAGLVLALSSEGIASAMFARLWFPAVPVWPIALAVIIAVTLLNLMDVRAFAVVESAMAAVKLVAIAAFILLGVALATGLMAPGAGAGGPGTGPAFAGQPFLPRGVAGLAGSMLLVLFSYAGFETLGLAAPEAKDPARTVPRAVIWTVIGLVTLYVGAVGVVLYLLPVGAIEEEVSPMVSLLRLTGYPALAAGLNLVVMTASISTMLAAMYGLSRMIYSLAEEGQAPAFLKQLTPPGIPRNAILLSSAGMTVGVVLSYVLPATVYVLLVSSAGFALLFSYLMILLSQLVLRNREGCRPGACAMPGFPWSTWVGILLLVGAIAGMPLVPGQGPGLVAGIGLLLFFALAYMLFIRRPEHNETDDRVPLK
ncbi:MAG: amino acid permease [Symbiobacteriaceae bacterium]|jgi:AAT family amino acid transporter|nr:amino acid permease [Symbiobacteriaceae bacterium]